MIHIYDHTGAAKDRPADFWTGFSYAAVVSVTAGESACVMYSD